MSFAGACRVRPGPKHRHVVLTRNGNYSAFNGYHFTRSAYSSIRCLITGRYWRTKAGYVALLPDATDDEARRAI